MTDKPKSASPLMKKVTPFATGGLASCTAVACVQPIDLVKVRLQLSGELGQGKLVKSPFKMASMIYSAQGIKGFYTGLSAALMRQLVYGTLRMGSFRMINDKLQTPGQPVSVWKGLVAGLAGGAIGSVCGNPFDVSLIRMQSDLTLPKEQRRNYTGVFNAVRRIGNEEGIKGLWKGAGPTIARAMVLAAAQLATFEKSKEICSASFGHNFGSITLAAFISGFFTAGASLPFDFIKTRVQKQKADATGKMPYTSSLDCVRKVAKSEGVFAFYKGFGAYYMRICPITLILLVSMEFYNKIARKMHVL
eukprot:TRINITY_DN9002_c0_g1_i1.p1 TRINITY_DN9002_c0_g1~~TRINITY_DN9002_c0_g1_i1.p1  ORF type:complete len:305 (+),score=45.67 TRINITY_DN9002_c0_g1_i1:56-970(+)